MKNTLDRVKNPLDRFVALFLTALVRELGPRYPQFMTTLGIERLSTWLLSALPVSEHGPFLGTARGRPIAPLVLGGLLEAQALPLADRVRVSDSTVHEALELAQAVYPHCTRVRSLGALRVKGLDLIERDRLRRLHGEAASREATLGRIALDIAAISRRHAPVQSDVVRPPSRGKGVRPA